MTAVSRFDAVALPRSEHRRIYWNVAQAIVLLTLTIVFAIRANTVAAIVAGSGLVLALLRIQQQRNAHHLALTDDTLQTYVPRVGMNKMAVSDIASIQFHPASGSGLLSSADRFVIQHNRLDRQLEVLVLSATQKPLLEAFFRKHFPDQYQEPAGLPGFPPARE